MDGWRDGIDCYTTSSTASFLRRAWMDRLDICWLSNARVLLDGGKGLHEKMQWMIPSACYGGERYKETNK